MPTARAAAAQPERDSPRLPLWAVLCFLASGAAGLLYEMVWGKQLAYLLGGSSHAVATVVAAFLGGLALGARVLGPRLERLPRLERVYARLELGVAAAGLLMLPLLRSLDPVVGPLYRALGGESVAFAVVRVALLMLLLVPPAALMGATLPVLVARCERRILGSGLAWLYAINTLGAVLGSLLGGLVLMPALGLTGTTLVAAGLNLIAAAVAWRSAPAPVRPVERTPEDVAPAGALTGPARALFLAMFAVSGAAALLLQLAWVRLYGLVLGSSVYSFAVVLGVYLTGLALGSAWVARGAARGAPSRVRFALLQLGIAATATAGLHGYGLLPRGMLALGERAGTSWAGLLSGQILLVAPIVLPPCLLLGAAFPLATQLLQRGGLGASTGNAYAVNTLGTIAGSLITGFALLPALGVQGVVLVAATLSLLIGFASLVMGGGRRASRGSIVWALALTLACAAAAVSAPRWDARLMSLGTYRPASARGLSEHAERTGDPTRWMAEQQRVLYYRDGVNASVLVATDLDEQKTWMRVGGKVDASTGDMLTQVMLGVLPELLADSGARTLVVGHGSGATAAAALAAGSGRMDIVELERAVIEGSRFFHRPGEDPVDDPRVTLHVEDARTLLSHGAGRYDVIISEPSNPWIAGVNNLFTVDFYRRARVRLEPDGVFCQWVQLYELSPATFRSLLTSFLEVFPDAHLFCLWDKADALLIAAPPGRALSLERLRRCVSGSALVHAQVPVPEQVAMYHVATGASLRALAAGGERNTDERPFVEYRAPRDMIEVGRGFDSPHPGVTSGFALTPEPSPGAPFGGWPREAVVEWRARRLLETADAGMRERELGELTASGLGALATRIRASDAASGGAGAVAEARSRLAAADLEGARELALQALASTHGSDRVELLLIAGIAEFTAQRPEQALPHFRAAQESAPSDPRAYNYEARARLAAMDVAGARAALERGLARLPTDPVLTQALRALDALPAR